ncbi:MAG: hypothetical protein HY840_01135 [Bacteroidetes bacterium]|nr:hypothetical protein [Bacteroidota bacterium]
MFKSILVLESSWESDSLEPFSVWPLVNGFANASGIRAYHRNFDNTDSFCHWIKVFNNKKNNYPMPKLLYIAAHGKDNQICATGNNINRETIFATLKKSKNIEYVHFGSCLFGNISNLKSLLDKAKHIKMAAGYKEKVDWVDSTTFDLMLWQRISTRDEKDKNKKLQTVVENFVNNEVKVLAENLGFRCRYRYGREAKTIVC